MILEIKNLKTFFYTRNEIVKAVNDINLNIAQGEIHGIAGESGSGKSVMGLSIMKLLQHPGKIIDGNIFFSGRAEKCPDFECSDLNADCCLQKFALPLQH